MHPGGIQRVVKRDRVIIGPAVCAQMHQVGQKVRDDSAGGFSAVCGARRTREMQQHGCRQVDAPGVIVISFCGFCPC